MKIMGHPGMQVTYHPTLGKDGRVLEVGRIKAVVGYFLQLELVRAISTPSATR